jgi:hypothetical protein
VAAKSATQNETDEAKLENHLKQSAVNDDDVRLRPDQVAVALRALRALADATQYWLEAVASDGTVKILASGRSLEIIGAAYWEAKARPTDAQLQIRHGDEVISIDPPLS